MSTSLAIGQQQPHRHGNGQQQRRERQRREQQPESVEQRQGAGREGEEGEGNMQCKDCAYFDDSFPIEDGKGMCRANPPTAQNRHDGLFPIVKETGWCGCFESVEDDA